jgi:hypothetical protein
VHLHLDHAVALAGFAAAARDVEREAPGAVAALLGGIGFGHQLADRREQAGIGGRVAARRAADGGLVDVDDLVEIVDARDIVMRRRLGACAVYLACRFGIQRVVDQGGLARAGDAGHAGEQADGKSTVTFLRLLPRAPCTVSACRSVRAARGLRFWRQ